MDKEETRKLIATYVEEKAKLMTEFPIDSVVEIAEVIWDAYQKGKKVFACGNGGNAAYVANLITDLSMHPFVSEDKHKALPDGIPRLVAINLADSAASITAIVNDLGANFIFSQQLVNYAVGEGDVVFGFTGSGNSGNILEAFEMAKNHNAITIAITRGTGGKAKEMADHTVILPGTSTFPGQTGGNDFNFHYEDALSSISHMLTGIVKQRIVEKYVE